jgi:hypothetical protein
MRFKPISFLSDGHWGYELQLSQTPKFNDLLYQKKGEIKNRQQAFYFTLNFSEKTFKEMSPYSNLYLRVRRLLPNGDRTTWCVIRISFEDKYSLDFSPL